MHCDLLRRQTSHDGSISSYESGSPRMVNAQHVSDDRRHMCGKDLSCAARFGAAADLLESQTSSITQTPILAKVQMLCSGSQELVIKM